jgi:hypothetical protein
MNVSRWPCVVGVGKGGTSGHEDWAFTDPMATMKGEPKMFGASPAAGALALALGLGALAGCSGGNSLSSALKNPGTPGVEALRQALQSALTKHDDKRQCELFSPALIGKNGGSAGACAYKLKTETGPYSQSLEEYVAGGRIELLGNRAEYQAPPGTHAFYENEASGGRSNTGTVFTAIYTEGGWRITTQGE